MIPRNDYLRVCCLLLWLQLMCYIDVSTEATTLTVGYLANISGKHRQGHLISGAMTYAVEEVNRKQVLPGNYTLSFSYNDTKGETLIGTNAVIEMWRDNVIAFFGPENSCEVEATVAAALNLPMISYKCADSADKDISEKDYRNHFARTYPPNTKVVASIFELLRYYKWNKFSILYEHSELYETVVKSLEKDIGDSFTINHKKEFEQTRRCCAVRLACCSNPFTEIVDDTQHETRVYLFLGDRTDLGKFMTILQMRGLLSSGNYVVIYVDLESYTETSAHRYFNSYEEDYYDKMMACQSLLVIVKTPPQGHRYEEFENRVRQYNSEEPFKFKYDILFPTYETQVTPYAAYIYDAVTLYADALATALKNDTDPRDGREVMKIFRQREQYTSVTGADMRIDKDGDVEGNYTVLAWQPTPKNLSLKMPTGVDVPAYAMLPVGHFKLIKNQTETLLRFKRDKEILWVNPGIPPVDEPPCGFDGMVCYASPDKTKEIASGVLGSILVLSCFVIYMIYKNWKYEQEIDGLLWKIALEDIQKCGVGGIVHSTSRMSLASHTSIESKIMGQIFTQTGMFRGAIIAVKQLKFSKKIVDVSRRTKKEMKIIREMHHDQINQFIGACLLPNCIYIVTEYCSKGSLQDILENDDLKLDNTFIASLVFDLIKGMIYLHESDIKVHGNLKSSNCVVSSRWVLQITDFGLNELRASSETLSMSEHQYFRNLLWKAPELLRYPSINPFGTQKGDIYAFGIILHEIIARQGPFGYTELTPKEIVSMVKEIPSSETNTFRPPTQYLDCQDYVLQVMSDSWHERLEVRPDFQHIKLRLRKMREGMKSNIMDNMMAMMEKYAYNLEELVDERTVQLVEEKKKTEALLHRMLPKSVANQLMRGEAVIPESFDAVTIYFSDIVGFTAMSASSTPMEVVTFLNDLYTVFDDIISHYDVYKVETIGDAYMVVSGLPIRNGDNHAGEIASMALELLDAIPHIKIRHKTDHELKLRIGIHTGPVVAGVVGLTMPRYCLFGDTVNTASRMESNGEALKIHISPHCKEYLDKLGGYQTVERGPIKVKGKGEMITYWLEGQIKNQKRRHDSGVDTTPVLSLFGYQRPEDVRKKSPKLSDAGRRGSLAGRRNSSFINCGEDGSMGSAGMPAFLKLCQDSPKSPKRLSPHVGKEFSRFLRINDSENDRWYSTKSASSCGELNSAFGSEPPPSPSPSQKSPREKNPFSGKKPKLQCIYSEDCDTCLENPDLPCPCRSGNGEANNKNGLVNFDESLRPLLCSNDMKVDLILPKDSDKCSYLKPPVLRLPSKRWRSCDEIVLPKGSKSSLKEFFSGLLGNKAHDPGGGRKMNIPPSRMVSENHKEESLV